MNKKNRNLTNGARHDLESVALEELKAKHRSKRWNGLMLSRLHQLVCVQLELKVSFLSCGSWFNSP